MTDLLILTALQKEFTPLRKTFNATRVPKQSREAYQYYKSTVVADTGGSYSTVLVCAGGKGPAYTAAAIAHAIPRWEPQHVIMTGIAATVPGHATKLEQILVANTIIDLSEWKVLPSEDEVRAAIHECDFELVSSITDFLDTGVRGKVHVGVLVSQTSLVKSARFHDGDAVGIRRPGDPDLPGAPPGLTRR
jgi:nucleoside phosphorylase